MRFEYQLVYKGRADGGAHSPQFITSMRQQLPDDLKTLVVDIVLDGSPCVLRTARSETELVDASKVFQSVGAVTEIQRVPLPVQVPEASRQSSLVSQNTLSAFYQKYTSNLNRILCTLDLASVGILIEALLKARSENRQIIVFGNGGSAAAASHFVTDLAKNRFDDERSLFRILSLTDNTPWVTATANDFGYENVFVNQLKNLLQAGDVVIAISSSGKSRNILKAVDYAKGKGAETFGIVGFDGGELISACDHSIHIPTKNGQYGYMEDATTILGHIMSIFINEQDAKIWI